MTFFARGFSFLRSVLWDTEMENLQDVNRLPHGKQVSFSRPRMSWRGVAHEVTETETTQFSLFRA